VLEWIAALIGAANCIYVPLAFTQPQGSLFPLPGLYFIEIALIGVLVLVFVAVRPGLKARWLALPWIAGGIILAFVILGGFSIGFYLIPALIAFIAVGLLADRQAGGAMTRHLGMFFVATVVQGAVMYLLIQLA
jgi:hypothetical protein